MRYFLSSGEASGELAAVALAQAIARIDPQAAFEGIGGARMRAAGFTMWRDHTGWATLGPVEAIPRIPKMLSEGYAAAARIARAKPDVVVLIDFGAFHVRVAKMLRGRYGYTGPIVHLFPPAAWLDSEKSARAVAAAVVPITGFERQRDFYRGLGLRIEYFGHPLAPRYQERPERPAPPRDAGCVAMLPGSRATELKHHIPRLLDAYRLLQQSRPNCTAIAAAATDAGERTLRTAIARAGLNVEVVRGVDAALAHADAAWVASGTAVLETVLSGVPVVVLYVATPLLFKFVRRIYRGRYIALPNVVMDHQIVPELVQGDATPQRLAKAMDELLTDPQIQRARFAAFRTHLGPPDSLERIARFAVDLAAGTAA